LRDHYEALSRRRMEKLGSLPAGTPAGNLPRARILSVGPVDEQRRVLLRADLSDENGIRSYQVYVNDVPLFPGGKVATGRRVRADATIGLTAGDNKIEVSALNTRGAESLRAVQTVRVPGVPRGDLYFVGFGVVAYDAERLRNLHYADQDAIDLARYFESAHANFDHVHVKTFLNREADVASIAHAEEFLRDARIDDTLVMFVAGHGVRTGGADGTYYFLTREAKLDDLAHTAAPFSRLEDLLYGSKPRRRLLLMDTCQSGETLDAGSTVAMNDGRAAATARGWLNDPRPPAGLDEKVLAEALVQGAAPSFLDDVKRFVYLDLARRSGTIVLSSSQGGEASYELRKLKNGAFTRQLIRALTSGDADSNHDRLVDTNELRDFVARTVPPLTGGRQHPTVDRDNIAVRISFPIVEGLQLPRLPGH
jgi:hypothetical protein